MTLFISSILKQRIFVLSQSSMVMSFAVLLATPTTLRLEVWESYSNNDKKAFGLEWKQHKSHDMELARQQQQV